MSQMTFTRSVAEIAAAGPEDAEALEAAGLGRLGRYARAAAKGLRAEEAGLVGRMAKAITRPLELPAGYSKANRLTIPGLDFSSS
jgi:hypothetical protein